MQSPQGRDGTNARGVPCGAQAYFMLQNWQAEGVVTNRTMEKILLAAYVKTTGGW